VPRLSILFGTEIAFFAVLSKMCSTYSIDSSEMMGTPTMTIASSTLTTVDAVENKKVEQTLSAPR
jgi:hypothetical protein